MNNREIALSEAIDNAFETTGEDRVAYFFDDDAEGKTNIVFSDDITDRLASTICLYVNEIPGASSNILRDEGFFTGIEVIWT